VPLRDKQQRLNTIDRQVLRWKFAERSLRIREELDGL
jgi:hypothetical protein